MKDKEQRMLHNKEVHSYLSLSYNSFLKDKNGDQLADSHNILNRLKNYFSHLPNALRICDIRQV
jgi:hypothetical protein